MKWLILFASGLVWAAAPKSGEPTCAKSASTLHKGAGAQTPVTWKVSRYMPFMRFESKGGWVHVQDFEGEHHWIQARDLTSAYRCVVVKTSIANLRQAPQAGAASAELHTVDRFTPFKKLEAQNEWVHIEDETGRTSWIHENNVWRPLKVQSVDF